MNYVFTGITQYFGFRIPRIKFSTVNSDFFPVSVATVLVRRHEDAEKLFLPVVEITYSSLACDKTNSDYTLKGVIPRTDSYNSEIWDETDRLIARIIIESSSRYRLVVCFDKDTNRELVGNPFSFSRSLRENGQVVGNIRRASVLRNWKLRELCKKSGMKKIYNIDFSDSYREDRIKHLWVLMWMLMVSSYFCIEIPEITCG